MEMLVIGKMVWYLWTSLYLLLKFSLNVNAV